MSNSDISATSLPPNDAKNGHAQGKGRTALHAGGCQGPEGSLGPPLPCRAPSPWGPGQAGAPARATAVPVPGMAAWGTSAPACHLARARWHRGQWHGGASRTRPSTAATSLPPNTALTLAMQLGSTAERPQGLMVTTMLWWRNTQGDGVLLLTASLVSNAEKQACSSDHTYVLTWLTYKWIPRCR